MTYIVNWPRVIAAQLFWVLETNYFGWNALPSSPTEVLCDGLFMLMMIMAIDRRTNTSSEQSK